MKLQKLLSYVRRAVDDYHMIEEGDKIAVGVSGGKDSICLLLALNALKRFYPKKFEIEAITVSLGLPGAKYDDIQAVYCASDDMALGVVQAIKNAGREGDGIYIWGGNGTPNGLQAILDGDMYGTSFCNQYAEMCCAISTALFCISTGINGSSLGVDYVPTINYPVSKITPQNAYYPIVLWDYCLDYYANM